MSRVKKSNHKTIKVTIIIYTFCVYRGLDMILRFLFFIYLSYKHFFYEIGISTNLLQ